MGRHEEQLLAVQQQQGAAGGTKGRQAAQRPAGLRAAPCCLAVQALADCSQISYVVTVFLLGCWLCTLKKISLFASLWNISSRELTL